MNKTLLLIMCDFMLLNLLALTRWEQAEPPPRASAAPAAVNGAATPTPGDDMVALMKVSLEDEQAARAKLTANLESTNQALAEKERRLAETNAAKGQLENNLAQTTAEARALQEKFTAASAEATRRQAELDRTQQALTAEREAAQRRQEEVAKLERDRAADRARLEELTAAARVAQRERELAEAGLAQARERIEQERAEKQRLQEHNEQLAQGVGKLAEKSEEISREVRDSRPANPNEIFGDFMANRVEVALSARQPGLFGESVAERTAQTVLVADGGRMLALLHLGATPFSFVFQAPPEYSGISVQVRRGPATEGVSELQFLENEPRVIFAPVGAAEAARLGAKIYRVAAEPFKYPSAVLVRPDDGKYGETPLRIDLRYPGYAGVDNRIITKIFGEFSPRRGDLVLNKDGELIGVMANSGYCLVLAQKGARRTLSLTEAGLGARTARFFSDFAVWSRGLPSALQ